MFEAGRTFICIYLVFFMSRLILQMDELKEFLSAQYVVGFSFLSFLFAILKPSARFSLQVADVHIVTFICICLVFFVSGLTLRTDELKESLTRRTIQGTIFGFLSIVGLTPLLAYAVRDLPFSPKEFSTGLAIFCLMPTTLGVGVSLVTSAKVRDCAVQLHSRSC
jgi:sodium/bile acid cotransporter 7